MANTGHPENDYPSPFHELILFQAIGRHKWDLGVGETKSSSKNGLNSVEHATANLANYT